VKIQVVITCVIFLTLKRTCFSFLRFLNTVVLKQAWQMSIEMTA
jgi:hypothetical protein